MGARSARFPRTARLLKSWQFRRASRHSKRIDVADFIVLVATTAGAVDGPHTRLGLTVSKKVGNAVVRNRVKRHVREWFRTHMAALPPDVDLVVIARRSAGSRTGMEINETLSRALIEVAA